MEKLSDDLSALILNKKLVADTVSLYIYNECGTMFYLTRNMSDPNWFIQFILPTADTVRHICDVCFTGNTPKVQAKWMKPILTRNENTLKFLFKKKLADFHPEMSHCISYIYNQGGDATPPPFAEIGGCANTEPTDDARTLAVRKWYDESYHGYVNYEGEFDVSDYDDDDVATMIDIQFDGIMGVIRALVAEV
jgi:hypothetical protein